MVTVRKASDRGRSQIDWLDSRHTFSFADYMDPRQMGFGRLRVINEDVVAPGRGFGRHPHRDMEILSYVLEGALEHGDSMGNGSVIRPGDLQRMTAGTGVVHSERNHSPSQPVHFLQIWIEPESRGLPPGYEQKSFADDVKRNALRLIASRDGRDGSVTIHQDTSLYTGALDAGAEVPLALGPGRRAWVQVVRGDAVVNGQPLATGDGAAVTGETRLAIKGGASPAEVLVFDLA
jgi:redox-sensitive bicupin YhaK (pirin superfamily)